MDEASTPEEMAQQLDAEARLQEPADVGSNSHPTSAFRHVYDHHVILLHEQGLTLEEIGDRFGKTRTTIQLRLRAALRRRGWFERHPRIKRRL